MNIVLIGMPGCGKSSVGAMVARETNRDFFETDALVEEVEGRSISAIFAAEGEDYFRDIEAMIATDVSQVENAVISTGGGMILRPENMATLAATGVIVFIDRDPAEIAAENHDGRPLLAGDKERVFSLYTQRIDLYRKYAQYTVKSGKTPGETAGELLKTMWREGSL